MKDLYYSILLGSVVIFICSCTKEQELKVTNDIIKDPPNEIQTAKYDSVYSDKYKLYIVNNDTLAYKLPNSFTLSSSEQKIGNALADYSVEMLINYNSNEEINTFFSPLGTTMVYSLMSNFTDNKISNNIFIEHMNINNTNHENLNSYFGKVINHEIKQKRNDNIDGNYNIINNLWLQENNTIYRSFLSTSNYYNLDVKGVDFKKESSLSEINNKIKNQIGNFGIVNMNNINNRQSLITSSVQFKNKWKESFSVDSTSENVFTSYNGQKVQCQIIKDTRKAKIGHFQHFDMLEIPYKDNNFSMYVVLPHTPNNLLESLNELKKNGLQHCIEITNDTINRYHLEELTERKIQRRFLTLYGDTTVIDTLISDTVIDIRIPKFNFNATFELNPQNVKYDLNKNLYQTNLPGVSPNGFVIGNILQSFKIEIDEDNTSASVLDSVKIREELEFPNLSAGIDSLRFGSLQPIRLTTSPLKTDIFGKKSKEIVVYPFHVSHPFIIFIRENDLGTITFACCIKNIEN